MNHNDHQWSKLGIDLLLGSKMDVTATSRQVMFLPDYLMNTLNEAKAGNKNIVLSSHQLIAPSPENTVTNFITRPEVLFSALFLMIVILSLSKNYRLLRFVTNFDGLLFFVTGLLGVLILFMWFGTDHVMCKNNYNLLWAWPLHAVAAFYVNKIRKEKKIIRIYFKLAALVNLVVLLCWLILPQHLNTALIPVVMLLLFRSAVTGVLKLNQKPEPVTNHYW